jgi:hypothetical protein
MKSILVDWLIEVHRKFELTPETLYLSINIPFYGKCVEEGTSIGEHRLHTLSLQVWRKLLSTGS